MNNVTEKDSTEVSKYNADISHNDSSIYLNVSLQSSKKIPEEEPNSNDHISVANQSSCHDEKQYLEAQNDQFRERANTDDYERPLSRLFIPNGDKLTNISQEYPQNNNIDEDKKSDTSAAYDPYETVENVLLNDCANAKTTTETSEDNTDKMDVHKNDHQLNDAEPVNNTNITNETNFNNSQDDHIYAVYFEPANTEADLIEQLSRKIKLDDVIEKENIGQG